MAATETLGSKRLSLLGSTGSIGEQTLAVAAAAELVRFVWAMRRAHGS